MSGKLAKELQQRKPFATREEEAFLNLARTFGFLEQRLSELLREYALTPTQYNMLRILRGAGPAGITCSQAAERMITPEPDVTRLLDRMENRGLIQRERSRDDRRVVVTRITGEGLALSGQIEEPLRAFFKRYLSLLGQQKLKDLIETLEELRQPGA